MKYFKIKEIRKKNGDTLKELAKKINYDYSNLSKIERGLYEPSLSLLQKIADVYNVNVSHFFNGNNHTPEEISFVKNLDLSSKELNKKYDLLLDGKKISEPELELVIEIIRKLRKATNELKDKD
ncbi:helix-turn-helix domain-containing protein [Priestia abyssalis]|uniref:helix-turn-helix domain-containing protein n=1 Tax=Priestia abyssalis TaxID=1221450 RepID=UPI0009954CBD|nr:helix-turn-helix transcriptional regulator [Priestia abyssalis]